MAGSEGVFHVREKVPSSWLLPAATSSSKVFDVQPFPSLVASCPAGFYANRVAGRCWPCTSCDSYRSACSSLADAVCSVSVDGFECGACPAHEFISNECGKFSDRDCSACLVRSVADCPVASIFRACTGLTAVDNSACLVCPKEYFIEGEGCTRCAECEEGQYVSSECTALTDTVCTACAASSGCQPGHIVTGVCSGVSTVDDSACSACAEGTYAVESQSCEQCGVCPTGSYVHDACTTEQDAVCRPCRFDSCSAYEIASLCTGSEVTDVSSCTACDAGSYFVNGGCAQCSTCGENQLIAQECGGSSDTVCDVCATTGCEFGQVLVSCTGLTSFDNSRCIGNCASGSFLNLVTTECQQCSFCAAGDYVQRACGTVADTVCSACAYQSCANPNTVLGNACTGRGLVDESECVCMRGTYLVGGACTSCSVCAEGTYTSTQCSGTTDSACSACRVTSCPTGQIYVPCSSLAPVDSSRCLVLSASEFAIPNEVGTLVVTPCSPPCGANQYQSAACSGSQDRECTACQETASEPGYTLVACTGSETSDVSRLDLCPYNTFWDDGDCLPCTTCPTDEYNAAECDLLTDTVCRSCAWTSSNCPAGHVFRGCDNGCYADFSSCGECPSGTYLSANVCTNCRTCGAGQFVSATCTPASDTVCEDCTIQQCGNGFRFTACTGIESSDISNCMECSDGQCEAGGTCQSCIAACREGQYESVPCTSGRDRVCRPCARTSCGPGLVLSACDGSASEDVSVCSPPPAGHYVVENLAVPCGFPCGSHTFESVACTPTTDRECVVCQNTSCTDGSVLTTTCTGTTSTDVSECAVCPMGTFEISEVCTTCSTCASDQFIAAACDSTQDTVCAPCQWNAGNCASGSMLTSCSGALTEDVSSCGLCAAGTYEVAGVCVPCTTCLVDQFVVTQCTSTTDRTCAACSITSCAPGSVVERCAGVELTDVSACAGCPTDWYLVGGECMPCTSCARHEFVISQCTDTTDVSCGTCSLTQCNPGSILSVCDGSTASDVSACAPVTPGNFELGGTPFPCTDACGEHYFEATACTATTDRVCQRCAVSFCFDGFVLDRCTGSESTDVSRCEPCADGEYEFNFQCHACKTSCPNGQWMPVPCGRTYDGFCIPCVFNQFTCPSGNGRVLTTCDGSTSYDSSRCGQCPTGTYVSGGSCVACTDCAAGQFTQTACSPTANRVCGACANTSCPPGHRLVGCTGPELSDVSSCEACTSGTFYNVATQMCTACSTCPDGSFEASVCENNSDAVCTACAVTGCNPGELFTACGPGVSTDVSSCTAPPAEHYVRENVSVPCRAVCDGDSFESTACTATTNRQCQRCTITACADGAVLTSCTGTETEDVSACDPCNTGTYEDNNLCLSCATCSAGEFVAAACTSTRNAVCAACAWTSGNCGTGRNHRACDGTSFIDMSSCGLCPPETYEGAGGNCAACLTCAVGQFESAACSHSSDRACSPCATTSCAAGSRITVCDGSGAVDSSACTPCRARTFLDAANTCVACGTCGADEYVSSACSSSSDATCATCGISSCGTGMILTPCTGVELSDVAGCAAPPAEHYVLDNIVVPCTAPCGMNQYEETACTASANRVCRQCRTVACDDGFIAMRCTGTESIDTSVCIACADDEYEFNNECFSCAVCGENQWIRTMCSRIADAVCGECMYTDDNCGSGFDLDVCDGTSVDDVSACKRCAAGTYEVGGECTACSVCAGGQFETGACTATTDRTCSMCSVTSCMPGLLFIGCPGTEIVDNSACINCPEGTYHEPNTNTCVECVACTRHQFISTVCAGAQDTVCSACAFPSCPEDKIIAVCLGDELSDISSCTDPDPGFYVAMNAPSECEAACEAGDYEAVACTALTDRECERCQFVVCGDGLVLQNECTGVETEDVTACVQCPTGSYERDDVCVACDVCVADEYIVSECTSLTNRSCRACTWNSVMGCASGRELSECDGTTREDVSSCGLCPPNTYELSGVCTACTACGAHQFISTECTPTSNRVCTACANGAAGCAAGERHTQCLTGMDVVDVSRCTACPSGTYLDLANNMCEECTACARGSFIDTACGLQNGCCLFSMLRVW